MNVNLLQKIKKSLTWHVRKHHGVPETHESEGNNLTKRRKKIQKKFRLDVIAAVKANM